LKPNWRASRRNSKKLRRQLIAQLRLLHQSQDEARGFSDQLDQIAKEEASLSSQIGDLDRKIGDSKQTSATGALSLE